MRCVLLKSLLESNINAGLGEKVEGDHFICYIFLNGNDIIEINDQSVRKLDLSKVKTILEKNSYLFFIKNRLTIILPILLLKNIIIVKSAKDICKAT